MDGTELPLYNSAVVLHYQVAVKLSALVGAETLKVRVYYKYDDGTESLVDDPAAFTASQNIKTYLKEYFTAKGIKVTAQQTGGTFRSIDWEIYKI